MLRAIVVATALLLLPACRPAATTSAAVPASAAAAATELLAGPFADDGDLRGIYVFAVASVDEARKLTQTDPAIRSGALSMELHPWYGSAALGELRGIHERIAAEHP